MPGPRPVRCISRRRRLLDVFYRTFIGALLFIGPANAQDALSPPEAQDWRCWYTAPAHVTCAAAWRAADAAPKQILQIPLHTVPFDMEGVERLARSVLCKARTSCDMRFGPLEMLELEQLLDPLWAAAD